jgi:branched-chain amino acid transport system permease protein
VEVKIITQLLQQLINGLVIGMIYSLIALGYSMVFGILGFINYAHGEIFMLGSFIGWMLLRFAGLNFVVAMVGAMLITALLGVAIDYVAYKPIREKTGRGFLDAMLVSAIGVSIFVQTLGQLLWGTETHPVGLTIFQTVFRVGPFYVSELQIVIAVVAIGCMIGLALFTTKSPLGLAIRATSQDPVAARLMGINVNRTIALTFAIGSALAAASGLLVGVYFDAVYPLMGNSAGIKAFTAAVLGGIGSMPGAMLGGILIGVVETLGAAYISSAFRDGFAFLVLILTLLFMPSGLIKVTKGGGKV